MKDTKLTKLTKLTNVVDSILKQMAIKDLNAITITSIAKSSQVSRGWLYKYLGHNIEEVLTTCLKYFIEDLSKISDYQEFSDIKLQNDSFYHFTLGMLDHFLDRPHTLDLYFRYHRSPNLVGKIIDQFEAHFLEHLAQNLERCLKLDPTTAKIKARMLHFARMGLILSYVYNKELYQNDKNRHFFHQELKSYITQALGTM